MDTISYFTSLGFTEYEAKVYLALLDTNPATGYQISKQSGVPRSMVYEALGRLSQRGAILHSDEGRANLYRPIPPDVLLRQIAQEHDQLVEALRKRLKRKSSEDEDLIWTITGRNTILSYAIRMIQQSKEEIFVLLNDNDLEELKYELVNSASRSVNVAAVLTGRASIDSGEFRENDEFRVVRHPPKESELQELAEMSIVVVDAKECLIAARDGTHAGDEEQNIKGVTATITRNRNLVFIVRQFIWMELFTQSMKTKRGMELIDIFDFQDW